MTRAVVLVAMALVCTTACGSDPQPQPEPQPSPAVDPWQRARERGIDFRAVGQEPGWYLEVDYQGSLRLVYDYGEQDVSAPVQGSTLDVVTEAGRVTVRIEDRACSDVMSGQRFPKTVTVDVAGRRLEGCGRALDGTAEWTVSPSSAGPVQIGMTREAAEAALGTAFVPPTTNPECDYLRSENAPDGVLFMYVDERIARIDVTKPGVPTTSGVEVGSEESVVFEAYGASVARSPHKYTSGSYLTVASNEYRLVFETDNARVTRYRAGRLPEVEWVEGCA